MDRAETEIRRDDNTYSYTILSPAALMDVDIVEGIITPLDQHRNRHADAGRPRTWTVWAQATIGTSTDGEGQDADLVARVEHDFYSRDEAYAAVESHAVAGHVGRRVMEMVDAAEAHAKMKASWRETSDRLDRETRDEWAAAHQGGAD